MNIQETLKHNGISIIQFSEDFGLSRNTIKSYIEIFERDGKLPKEKYDIIFKRLFCKENNGSEFIFTYYSLKKLYQKDKANGSFDLTASQSDFLNSVIDDIKLKIDKITSDKHIEYFIKAFLNNFQIEHIFSDLAKYFYVLNEGDERFYHSLPEVEKIFITSYFKTFLMQKHNLLTLDYEVEKLFIARMNEIKKIKEISKK